MIIYDNQAVAVLENSLKVCVCNVWHIAKERERDFRILTAIEKCREREREREILTHERCCRYNLSNYLCRSLSHSGTTEADS